MKKIQITGLSIWDYSEKKEVIKFDYEDWIEEIDHHSQVNGELNKIRRVAKKIFQAKYRTNCQVHLLTKEL